MPDYTQKQGQYLAFIHYYTTVNRRAPAEADIQRFFNVTPPTVHQMILTLEKSGFVSKEQGKARTIKVLLPPDQIPYLE
jgi:Mn-dependent DtxR family transcriptional regulator